MTKPLGSAQGLYSFRFQPVTPVDYRCLHFAGNDWLKLQATFGL